MLRDADVFFTIRRDEVQVQPVPRSAVVAPAGGAAACRRPQGAAGTGWVAEQFFQKLQH